MTLSELREQSNMSVKEVAMLLDVSPTAVYNYELGIRRVSLEQVLALAKAYSVDTCEVITAQLKSISKRQKDR